MYGLANKARKVSQVESLATEFLDDCWPDFEKLPSGNIRPGIDIETF